MKTKTLSTLCFVSWFVLQGCGGMPQQILQNVGGGPAGGGPLSEGTIIAGLKEALSVGTRGAVDVVSKAGGYFKNPSIKIPMPPQMQKLSNLLGQFGFNQPIDNFVLSMNKAAEAAAPKAADLFIGAIKEMTFDDARKILQGGDTAGTDFLKSKTYDKLNAMFQPIVSNKMNSVGVTQAYKQITDTYNNLPLTKPVFVDVDSYVTDKALDGLFFMVGEEERKIRTDPGARVTDLLRKVFG